jgi:FkbM family methyltransferase
MAARSVFSTSSWVSVRTAAKRAVLASPVAPQARRATRLVESRSARRDRRDNDALTVLVAAALAPDSSAIDVGANEGRVLSEIVRVSPAGRHLAYEPIPELADRLKERFPNVEVRCAALSDEQGAAEFTHVKSNPGYSGLRERTYPGNEQLERIHVHVERLDETLPTGFVPAFIKIDVEGAEGKVMSGAIGVLERHRPMVVFEHGKGASPVYGTGPSEIYTMLVERAGMRIFDMDGGGPYSRDQLEETFHTGTHWNFFARP